FRPLAAVPPPQEMLAMRPELRSCTRVITRATLYEVSCVPIGSNPEALAQIASKGLRLSPELAADLLGARSIAAVTGTPVKIRLRTEDDVVREVGEVLDKAIPHLVDRVAQGFLR